MNSDGFLDTATNVFGLMALTGVTFAGLNMLNNMMQQPKQLPKQTEKPLKKTESSPEQVFSFGSFGKFPPMGKFWDPSI